MNTNQFSTSFWKRLLGILLGLALIFWLPVEDRNETIALLFAIFLCVWQTAIIFSRLNYQSPLPLYYFILIGTLAGAAVTPLTLLLLVFKIGLHTHPVSDYTNQQIISVIHRTPIWLIGGFFTSAGLGVKFINRQSLPESHHAADS